jgi:hypothetical protein
MKMTVFYNSNWYLFIYFCLKNEIWADFHEQKCWNQIDKTIPKKWFNNRNRKKKIKKGTKTNKSSVNKHWKRKMKNTHSKYHPYATWEHTDKLLWMYHMNRRQFTILILKFAESIKAFSTMVRYYLPLDSHRYIPEYRRWVVSNTFHGWLTN